MNFITKNTCLALLLLIVLNIKALAAVDEYYIECNPDDFAKIYSQYEEDNYINITLKYKGNTWENLEMRIRGDDSRAFPKKSLKIKFGAQPFTNGRSALNFNAEYLDKSYIRQYISGRIMRESGQPCFDSEYARLFLNGKFLGLYLRVENVDDDFLESRGLDTKGNLYKATNDGACLSIYDNVDSQWEKKTNTGSGREDLVELINILNTIPDEDFLEFAKEKLDYDKMVNIIAVNMLIANVSTYYHNYYMYHDINNSGKWTMFPWDLDKTLSNYNAWYIYPASSSYWTPDNPFLERALLCAGIFADIQYRIDELSGTIFNPQHLFPIIDSLKTELELSVSEDTTDQITNLDEWLTQIDKEKAHITEQTQRLKYQFNNIPRTFRVDKLTGIYTKDIKFTWHPSIDPNGDNISYTLYCSPFMDYRESETIKITEIKDTTYILKNNLNEGKYFWKVTASDGTTEVEGFDNYNILTVKKSYSLPSVIIGNLTLTKENSPYLATSTTTVSSNSYLKIMEGVEILLPYNAQFIVNGEIHVLGTTEEPVKFMPSSDANFWGKINIENPTGKCDMNNVILENGELSLLSADFTIDNFKINYTENINENMAVFLSHNSKLIARNGTINGNGNCEGITVYDSSATIENISLENLTDVIEFIRVNNGEIRKNRIINAKDDAIDINGSENIIISDNFLLNPNDKCISLGCDSLTFSKNIKVERNIAAGGEYGIAVKNGSNAIIVNNTFYDNGIAVYLGISDLGNSYAEVNNTVISKAGRAVSLDANSEIRVSYSLCDSEQIPGEHNIFGNPKFVSPQNDDFSLQRSSPCINAGDPNLPLDSDGTRSDIGAIAFDLSVPLIVINEINYNSASDFDTDDWVELYNASSDSVDLSGWILKDDDNAHEFIFPLNSIIKAEGYLVICRVQAKFSALFPSVQNYVGDMSFGLSGTSDQVRLFDADMLLIDSVAYDDGNPWTSEPDGNGATLELIHPQLDNTLPSSWAASKNHGTPGEINSVFDTNSVIPIKDIYSMWLGQNFPNPFYDNTTIKVIILKDDIITLKVYDIYGREVIALADGKYQKGDYYFSIEGYNLPIGAFYYVLGNSQGAITKSFMHLR